MLNIKKTGTFIANRRRELGLTQQLLAEKLNVSFQAVSKWENGSAYPNVELLHELSIVLDVTVDEIILGTSKTPTELSYSMAGVDITYTDSIKREIAKHMLTQDERVLNGVGPFASLYDISFPEIKNPVLVLKSEEPGSKQKLAMEYGYTESICHDMINHLVNDIIVMGARPLAVLDTIVCGNAEKDTISSFIKGMSDACKNNECSLIGGETSVQPQVIDRGVYILTSSIAGIIDKNKIIDGAAIAENDIVLGVASNGLHTNGYSLVRLLMDKFPLIKTEQIDDKNFIEQIMRPHTPYYLAIKEILSDNIIHGMAHITGGGIEGNLCRIIPDGLSANIDLNKIRPLPLFKIIKNYSNIDDAEMLKTFNCGIGFIIVVAPERASHIMKHVSKFYSCYEIGQIKKGPIKIVFNGKMNW